MVSMMGRIAVAAPILGAALCLAATPSRADAKAGEDAWLRGDYAAAVSEWQGLAAQGDADAQFDLAQAYKFGKGVPQDLTKAEKLFAEASAKGHIPAADNYGLLRFQRGDQAGALPYIQAAAERGDARAQYLLGIASFNGGIVPKDWARAYALLLSARQAGLPQAASAIAQMEEHIPPQQRQQAIALASGITEPAVPVELAPTPQMAPPRHPANASGRWRVQLGAFAVRTNADGLWNRVKARPELAGHPRIDAESGRVTRLLAGGFTSEAEASRACARLSASGVSCLVTRN